MTTPRTLDKPPMAGILQSKVFGLPVDKEFMFSNHKDRYKPRVEKRQRKLITKISYLRSFLEPEEHILLVTTGHSPRTFLEKLGIGWLLLFLKRSLMIFTDRRIFHVPTTPTYRYRYSISQILYAACESIQMKRASLLVQYRGGGEAEKFFGVSGREKKKIRELLKTISFDGPKTGISGRAHLCPQCAATLYGSDSKCRSCGLRFKSGAVAAFLAILLPGGGYFYLRRPVLGAIVAVLEICTAVLIGLPVSSLLAGAAPNLLWLVGGSLILCLLKAFAVIHSRVIVDEFVPRTTDITFQTAAGPSG